MDFKQKFLWHYLNNETSVTKQPPTERNIRKNTLLIYKLNPKKEQNLLEIVLPQNVGPYIPFF